MDVEILFTAQLEDLIDVSFDPIGSAFILPNERNMEVGMGIKFSTASEIDKYDLRVSVGDLSDGTIFTGNTDLNPVAFKTSAHVFNAEVDEQSQTLHLMCHLSNLGIDAKFLESTTCCVISINTTFTQEFTSCLLKTSVKHHTSTCYTSILLPSILWKQKVPPKISLAYAAFPFLLYGKNSSSKFSADRNTQCQNYVRDHPIHWSPLSLASIVHSVPDAIREIERVLLVQVPRRELRMDEEFVVPIRLKQEDFISEFIMRYVVFHQSYMLVT